MQLSNYLIHNKSTVIERRELQYQGAVFVCAFTIKQQD